MRTTPTIDLRWSLWSTDNGYWLDRGYLDTLRAMESAFNGKRQPLTVKTEPRKEIRFGTVTIGRGCASVFFWTEFDDDGSVSETASLTAETFWHLMEKIDAVEEALIVAEQHYRPRRGAK